MNGKGYSDSMTIGLISVVCIAFVLSVYFFASMFVFTGSDMVEELPNNDLTIENKDPVVDPEIEAKIQALKKEIETYDKILSSNYMLLVNKSNPIPEDFNQTSLMDTESNPVRSAGIW